MFTKLLIISFLLFQPVFSFLLGPSEKENPAESDEVSLETDSTLPKESLKIDESFKEEIILNEELPHLTIEPEIPIPKKSDSQGIELTARSAAVLDRESQKALFEKNIYFKVPMASLTKIMTAIIVLESASNLDEQVTISLEAAKIEPKEIKLQVSEQVTIKDLLYAALVTSANDAALALAEHIGPGQKEFVEKMNKKAIELELKDTHFADSTGLNEEGNYSCAYDLARLFSHALENETIRKILETKEYTIVSPIQKHWFKSTNELLGEVSIIGGKTGFTDEAGWCLVVGAQNEQGNEIISVILGAPSRGIRSKETKTLIDWTFGNYTWE